MISASSGNMFFFSSRRRHTRLQGDWSSDVCSSDLVAVAERIRRKPGETPRSSFSGHQGRIQVQEILETLGAARRVNRRAARDIVIASRQDRKSTRLNSSHLVISYAVFCLKKKKKYT